MSTLSIYDVLQEVIATVDAEIARVVERAFDADTPYRAGVAFQYAYTLRTHLLHLVSAQDKDITSVFAAVTDLNAFIECPF